MKKKFLSLILIICLAVSAMPVMAKSSVKSVELLEAVEILQTLDMISTEYDKLTIDENKTVTKAEFANIAAGIFAHGMTSDKLYFHDVSRTHWAFNSIAALVDAGVVKINDEQKFYPDEIISRADAAEMILLALGYGPYLEMATNFGMTIDAAARDAKLYKGTSGRSELTFADMVMMLYNGISSEVLEPGFADKNMQYKGSGKTYLEKYYSIYFEEGLLEGYDGISTTSTEVRDGEAVISGTRFVSNMDLADLLGNQVLYFYSYNEDSDERTLLWIKADEDEQTLTLYHCENEVTFNADSYSIKYYETDGNKEKNIKISPACKVIYNGEFVSSGIEQVLSAPFYTIKLIGDSNVYETAVIWAYDNYTIGGIDKIQEGFYDKTTMEYISLKNVDRLDIFADNGVAATIDDLLIDDCVSVYKSLSGKRVKLIYSRRTVSGVVTNAETYENYRYLTIDGVTYRSAGEVNALLAKSGENVTLYLDALGYISRVEYAPGTSRFAYVIKATYKEDDDKLLLKLFDQNGSMQVIEVAEKVKIDETRYKAMDIAFAELGGKNLKPQLISYEKNADGLIKTIDTVKIGGSLYQRYAESNQVYRNVGKFGRKMFLDNDTIIFAVPSDPLSADIKDFSVKSKGDLSADGTYAVSSYATSNKVDFEEILVITDADWNQANDEAGILVQSIQKQLNDDDEVVECIVGYQGTQKVKMPCSSGYLASNDGVVPGSYITYSSDADGNIKKATVKYYVGMPDNKRPKETNLYQRMAITTGYVNSINGMIVGIGTESGADFDEAYNFNSATVLIYDTSNNKITVGGINDLISYEAARSNCSFILAHMRYSAPKVYIIYK